MGTRKTKGGRIMLNAANAATRGRKLKRRAERKVGRACGNGARRNV